VRDAWCICSHVQPSLSRTEIVIVRHQYEAWRASGTARIAELALPQCRVVQANSSMRQADGALGNLDDAWLLFPGGSFLEQLGPPPPRLVVLDGTWREVRRMQRRLPALWDLPRFSLPAKTSAPLRLRHSPGGEHRSTLEAIADALSCFEGSEVAAPLMELHTRFVEHSLKARGAWSYRGPG
jgi:DTW domain-containing protein YfiP